MAIKMTATHSKNNLLALAKLKAGDMAEWPRFIDVESDGIVYQFGYKPSSREYVAKNKLGDRYEASSLSEIKAQVKSDSAPARHKPVTVDGKTVGHVMNQLNEFFFRPVGTKDIGEKFWDSEPVLQSLRDQGMKLD